MPMAGGLGSMRCAMADVFIFVPVLTMSLVLQFTTCILWAFLPRITLHVQISFRSANIICCFAWSDRACDSTHHVLLIRPCVRLHVCKRSIAHFGACSSTYVVLLWFLVCLGMGTSALRKRNACSPLQRMCASRPWPIPCLIRPVQVQQVHMHTCQPGPPSTATTHCYWPTSMTLEESQSSEF